MDRNSLVFRLQVMLYLLNVFVVFDVSRLSVRAFGVGVAGNPCFLLLEPNLVCFVGLDCVDSVVS